MIVVSDRNARNFNTCGATLAVYTHVFWQCLTCSFSSQIQILWKFQTSILTYLLSNRHLRFVMGSLRDISLLMLVLLKTSLGPTSFLQLIIFLMLFLILLSMLMILLSTVSVLRLLICGKSWSYHLNLNLTETMWSGVWRGLLILILEKLNLLHLMVQIIVSIDDRMHGFVLDKKSSCKMLELIFPPKCKTHSKETEVLIRSKFLSSEVRLPYTSMNLAPDLELNTIVTSRVGWCF